MWGLYETGTDIQLNITVAQSSPALKGRLPSCATENFELINLLGHCAHRSTSGTSLEIRIPVRV